MNNKLRPVPLISEDNHLNKLIGTVAILTLAWQLFFNIDFPNLLRDLVTSHAMGVAILRLTPRLNAEVVRKKFHMCSKFKVHISLSLLHHEM